MKDLLAANRYAQALFNIARMLHKDEEIEAELEAFSTALKKSTEFNKFFENPGIPVEQKIKSLLRIYQERNHEIYEVLINFFSILLEKNRFELIHEIAVSFKRIADEAQGQGVAQILTAIPLEASAEKDIVLRLEKIAGYTIKVQKIVNPELVGGVVVKVRNKILDGSVKSQIDGIKKTLTKIRSI